MIEHPDSRSWEIGEPDAGPLTVRGPRIYGQRSIVVVPKKVAEDLGRRSRDAEGQANLFRWMTERKDTILDGVRAEAMRHFEVASELRELGEVASRRETTEDYWYRAEREEEEAFRLVNILDGSEGYRLATGTP